MKRLIASAVALSVLAAPAVAATTNAAPAKVTKQVKKSSKLAANSSKAKTSKPKK
jgi:ABC-type phosphate transport system permease subunit